jgi:hypothetical protein
MEMFCNEECESSRIAYDADQARTEEGLEIE